MKKILFSLLLCCAALSVTADPISREQARQRAEEFLLTVQDQQTASRRLSPVQNRAKLAPRRGFHITAPDDELYYVFNRGENQGYVIASGNDSTHPVLGYTDEGEFDYAQLPENMKWWLQWMTAQLEDLTENPSTTKRAPLRAPTHEKVATLCTSRWNQGSPYNQDCPVHKSGERCVTGCVATAIAQILYFHRAKSVLEIQKDIPGYTYNGMNIAGVPAGSPIDWDNMIDNYGGSPTAKQKNAVAQLMRYCGVGVQMMYGVGSEGGSAAYSSNVADCLKNYFGYGNSVKYVSTSDPGGDSWDNTLYKEVAAGRPVYLSGSNKDGGHAFVCDGYDGNHCFHINWGWGGGSDGYYLLSKLNPGSQGIGGSTGGYSDYPEAVIGIEPENYATRAMPISNPSVKKLCLANFDADNDGTFTFGEAAAVTDLGEVFKGQTITSFNELYNFTGLTILTPEAFAGCTKLANVKLPKNLKSIGARTFQGCTALKSFVLPDGLTAIGDEAFDGCKAFTCTLSGAIQTIGANAFRGCAALTKVELPIGMKSLGAGAYADCAKLKEVTLRSICPQDIQLGDAVFQDVDVAAATLNVPQGTKSAVSANPQWSAFGIIYEMRDLSRGQFVQPTTGKKYYLYNLGTGRYLTKGEAWGTQAVVEDTDNPMRFELKQTGKMPEGVYYLYSDDTGKDNHVFFRTSEDQTVGQGVKACFVDGENSHTTDKTSWWALAAVDGQANVFTLQVPSGVTGHKDGQYLGINPDHASNAASPTYGAYSDVLLSDFTENCYWMFVEYDELAAATYSASCLLKNLLEIATKQKLDVTREQAVYDNLASTEPEITKAQRSLRRKLGYIRFENDYVRQAAIDNGCDLDGNKEITTAEAAQLESFENYFTGNTDITTLHDLRYFTGLEYIAGNSFKGCTNLKEVTLPEQLVNIYYRAFLNCPSLTSIVIPPYVEFIGDDAFNGCTSLREVTVQAVDPSAISLGSDVFFGVDLSAATLCVPKGSAAAYREAPIWQDFGTIREVHAYGQAPFAELAENENIYVYNLGLHREITNGEAYGTQGVVGMKGLVYQLRRTKSMPADTYYLYATNLGTSNKVLFRTSTDSKVGEGVKTCFVDGGVDSKAYWTIKPVEGKKNVFTLQVPENQKDYVEGECLGVDLRHESQYTGWDDTYGLYWDINYDGNEANCQWAFIRKTDADTLEMNYNLAKYYAQLLQRARQQELDVTSEQAIYDNLDATRAEMLEGYNSLRDKLHLISFGDFDTGLICIKAWDDDEDDELSYEEAEAVIDLGTNFRSANTITSFEELRYFKGLTAIGDEAFRGCSKLISIYIPANVKSLGKGAFTSCSALRYAAVLTPQKLDIAESSLSTRNLTLFVPTDQVSAYQESEDWAGTTVKEYTGKPVVTAESASREYGRANPKYTYVVDGAPINGAPELTATAEAVTPVGEYPIVVGAGTITSFGLQCVNGTLAVTPAQVTITAKSYTRNVGEVNPEFEVDYPVFRNREKAEDILLHEPVIDCDATPESPAGTYEIRVSGAQAQNYAFEYVNGTLTVIDPVGVRSLNSQLSTLNYYDLSGRKLNNQKTQELKNLPKGIYITDGKKVTVK